MGNFPGVTVDQKSGAVRGQKDCTVVDLPGIYSIRPYTPEEIVTRDFIIDQKPDGIINIVDATNIERNLYLTLQLMEMRIPMVLALNMMDEVTSGVKKGTANEGDYSIVTKGDIHAFGLEVSKINCKVTGNGLAEITPKQHLKAQIVGKGNIRYQGPTAVDQRVIGKGKVEEVVK